MDYTKDLKPYYFPPKKPEIVEIPPFHFLMVDGEGDPNISPAYQKALHVLYGLSFTLKFANKRAGRDYKVMPLEGLWWKDDPSGDWFDKSSWKWTMMIQQPDFVSAEQLTEAQATLSAKHKEPAYGTARLETYAEGLCVQVMYFGAYNDEHPTIMALHDYAHQQGYSLRGKHHEIYLGDPRKTAPEKLRTVLRQPIEKRS